MQHFSHDNLAKFVGLVAATWNDASLSRSYQANPVKVLADHGITLPQGVPAPVLPGRPSTGLTPEVGAAWKDLTFDNWDLTIQHLPAGKGQASTQLKISSLACIACPYSCFSSLSN